MDSGGPRERATAAVASFFGTAYAQEAGRGSAGTLTVGQGRANSAPTLAPEAGKPATRPAVRYVELWTEGGEKTRKKKAASKTRYTCPQCHANAWAKPQTKLICGECHERMLAEGGDSEEGEQAA